jgi:hypothetical protein
MTILSTRAINNRPDTSMSPFYLKTMLQFRNFLHASLIMNCTQNDDFTTHLAPSRVARECFNDNGNQDEAAIFEVLTFKP